MKETTFDLPLLAELRDIFLSEKSQSKEDYWQSTTTLHQYDISFGRRILWKWRAVLNELSELGWTPAGKRLIDFGCGTGVATEAIVEKFGADSFSEAVFSDRSKIAEKFCHEKFSTLKVSTDAATDFSDAVVLLSHLSNEISATALENLLVDLTSAHSIIWVEPGTPEHSRRLISVREELSPAFQIWAPCPHQAKCGMLVASNARHWCHHFAPSPAEIHQSRDWRKFSEGLKIDLRSLPVSYLVLSKEAAPKRSGFRVIGRPRTYTGYAQALTCGEQGVGDKKIMKRDNPADFKGLQKDVFCRSV